MRLFENTSGKTPYNSVIHWTNHPRVLSVFLPRSLWFYDIRAKKVSAVHHKIDRYPMITAAPVCTNGWQHLICLDSDIEYGSSSTLQVLDTRYLRHPLISWKVDAPPLRNIFTYPSDRSPVAIGYNDCRNIIACPMEVSREGLYFPKTNAIEFGEFIMNVGALTWVKKGIKTKYQWRFGGPVQQTLKAEPYLKGVAILEGKDRLNKPKILALTMLDSLVYCELQKGRSSTPKAAPLTPDEIHPPQFFHSWVTNKERAGNVRELISSTIENFAGEEGEAVEGVTEMLNTHWEDLLKCLDPPKTSLELYEEFKDKLEERVSPFDFYKGLRNCARYSELLTQTYHPESLQQLKSEPEDEFMTPFDIEETKEGELSISTVRAFAGTVFSRSKDQILGDIEIGNINIEVKEEDKMMEDLTLDTLLSLETEEKTDATVEDFPGPLLKSLGESWEKNRPQSG